MKLSAEMLAALQAKGAQYERKGSKAMLCFYDGALAAIGVITEIEYLSSRAEFSLLVERLRSDVVNEQARLAGPD